VWSDGPPGPEAVHADARTGLPARDASPAPALTAARLVHVMTVGESLRFLGGQTRFMQARGIEVHAVTSPGPELEAFGVREGVPTHAVEMPRRIAPLQDLVALWRLYRLLRRLRPHVVHAHTPKGGLLGTLAAWLARVPVRIYHMRGLPLVTATGWRRTLLGATEMVACRFAHQVLCVSHSIRDVAVAERLCAPDKIKVLRGGSGNGVDAEGIFTPASHGPVHRDGTRARLGIPAEALVVGFVGRLVRDKGIVELAEAWRLVRESHPEAHLLAVGPQEPRDPVPPATLAFLGADARVHLVGAAAAAPMLAAMDVLALPTYREGFPNVLLEASAMELPVVATQVAGCTDAVHATTGTLVPPRDAAALAAAIRRYLDDPALRRAHGTAGRARVMRDFRQQDIWAAIHAEYTRLLRRATA